MDSFLFDALARSLTIAGSRRCALTGLLAGALGLLTWSGTQDAAAKNCKKIRNRAKRKKCLARSKDTTDQPPTSPPPPSLQLAFECPPPAANEGTFLTGGEARVAQTFTAGRSGNLRQIQVGIIKPATSTGDYVVQLLKVLPTGVPENSPAFVLAAVTIPDATVAEGETTVTGSFIGTPLVANTIYAVAIVRPEGTGPDSLTVRARQGIACGGQLFSETGTGFSAIATQDMIVSVFVA